MSLDSGDLSYKPTRPEWRFGEGKISGVISVFLGWLALGAVVALHFPEYFSTPELRASYPMGLLRSLIDLVLFSAMGLGVISLFLSERKTRGVLGAGLAILALALGGSRVPIEADFQEAPYLALDWFLLSIFFLAVLFVPMERAFGRVKQRLFRREWRTDLTHFAVSHLLVQVTVLLTTVPATMFLHWAVSDRFQAFVSSMPVWLQALAALFVADLFAYVAHRLFHEVPWLWRFHAIHHSSQQMDWLAASRLHLLDVVVTRAFGFIPLYVLGFSNLAIGAYLTWASFQGILNHANLRFSFGPLRHLLVTPQFHHWHHSIETYNKNFAAHLPIIDRIFGTHHLPGAEWPEEYGIEGHPVPEGYLEQVVYPLTRGSRQLGEPGFEDGEREEASSSPTKERS